MNLEHVLQRLSEAKQEHDALVADRVAAENSEAAKRIRAYVRKVCKKGDEGAIRLLLPCLPHSSMLMTEAVHEARSFGKGLLTPFGQRLDPFEAGLPEQLAQDVSAFAATMDEMLARFGTFVYEYVDVLDAMNEANDDEAQSILGAANGSVLESVLKKRFDARAKDSSPTPGMR